MLVFLNPCCSLFPCSVFWKLLLAHPRTHTAARPLTIHGHVSRSCCLWIHEWRRGVGEDGAADYMPASRQEAHLTQPIWSTDKASFQTWLRRVDKRQGSWDYTCHRLCDRRKYCFSFQYSLISFFWDLKPSHLFTYVFFRWANNWQPLFHITLKSAKVDSTNVDWEGTMFSSWKEDLHHGFRAPHADHQSRNHSFCTLQNVGVI